jgi:hypothetical protein
MNTLVLEKDGNDQLVRSCEKRCLKKGKRGIGHFFRRNYFLKHIIKGKIEGRI